MSGTNVENGPMDANMRQAKASGIGRSCAVLLQQAHGRVKAGPLLSSETSGAGRAGAAIAPTNLPGNQVLKCPRCNSLNTKFCYYNNYSLLQPRHFCKNCRRYWTKGGALRNVPVGGGCRKNKRGTSEGGCATTTSSARSSKQGLSMISSTLDKDVSCRNIISAHLLAAVPSRSHSDLRVQPSAGLQHSFTTPAPTHLPSLYNYSSKTSLIQPSLSNSHLNIAQLSPSSNRTQYVQPHADHVLSPHHGSFHSFLNLKQAISSLSAPNHLNNIPVMLPAHSLLPSPFNYDHISTPANFTQAMQAPISNQPFMGLDLINMTSPKPAVTPSTITTTPAGGMLRNSSSSALHEGFNQSDGQDDHVQIRADLHQSTGMKISRDQQMMISKELQPFRSSPLITSTSLHQLQAVSMSEHRQLIMPSSPSMKAHELVSDNFKMKGDQLPDQPAAQAVACTASWVGQGNGINSFLEPSEDETFWSCNPSSWPDDL